MPPRDVILYPNPLLRQKSAPLEPASAAARDAIAQLWDTLDAHTGVGLSAPQIGLALRAIVVDATRARRPCANRGRVALLNPEIIAAEGQIAFREGCMSIPDLVAHVRRHDRITIAGHTPDGERCEFESSGFEAVIFQHEIDHLDGILFIDRVHHARDLKPR